MSLRQEATTRRLEMFGLTKSDSIRLVKHINDLILNNGPEWTISRLKAIKVGFIQHLAGNVSVYEWIKTKNLFPSGALRPIYRLKNPQKVLSCLMIYSDLVSSKVTTKQWKKFKSSVEKVRTNSFLLFPAETAKAASGRTIKNVDFKSDHTIRMYQSEKRSPNYLETTLNTVKGNAMNALNSFGHGKARKFILTNFYSDLPEWFNKEMHKRWSTIIDVQHSLKMYDYVGRISFIQEPGFKLRSIANPLPCFQILLEPLKVDLLDILSGIKNDFTHSQDQGCDYIRNLISYRPVSSIDLSDASNNLPLEDQLRMLRAIYGTGHPLVDLFHDISTSKWIVDGPDGEQFLKWNTGQPLGLGPSFGSFALYHHFIVRYAMFLSGRENAIDDLFTEIRGQEPKETYDYAIVGDDVVIASEYEENYIYLLDSLECGISRDKCIFNSHTAEFCSRVITKDRVYRQYKWTTVSDKSFLDFARHHGPASVKLLRKKQQYVVNNLSRIPYTLGGPLSWNPEGISLEERENIWWKVAEELFNKIETDRSVPRDRLHYDLKKGLQLIDFSFPSNLKSLVHSQPKTASVVTDPIRVVMEKLINIANYDGPRAFTRDDRSSLMKQITECGITDITDKRLTEEERQAFSWILDPSSIDVYGNPYFEKLFFKMKKMSFPRQS